MQNYINPNYYAQKAEKKKAEQALELAKKNAKKPVYLKPGQSFEMNIKEKCSINHLPDVRKMI